MSDYDIAGRKRIAREHATDDPDHIGRDATGADHFWSVYDRVIIVVEDADVGTCDLDGVDRPLATWREYTARTREWDWHSITEEPLVVA